MAIFKPFNNNFSSTTFSTVVNPGFQSCWQLPWYFLHWFQFLPSLHSSTTQQEKLGGQRKICKCMNEWKSTSYPKWTFWKLAWINVQRINETSLFSLQYPANLRASWNHGLFLVCIISSNFGFYQVFFFYYR